MMHISDPLYERLNRKIALCFERARDIEIERCTPFTPRCQAYRKAGIRLQVARAMFFGADHRERA